MKTSVILAIVAAMTISPVTRHAELPYVIVRTEDNAAYSGFLKEHDSQVTLLDARMIVYEDWSLAMPRLATEGVLPPRADKCKLSCKISKITLKRATKILYCSDKAKTSIVGWQEYKEDYNYE